MWNIWGKYGEYWIREGIAYPALQIHDDLLIECKDEYVEDVSRLIYYEMENSVPFLTVPVKVGMKSGKIWGSMKKMEVTP